MARTLRWSLLLLIVATLAVGQSTEKKRGWTRDEVTGRLARSPDDAYLQYVAAQLAKRDGNDEHRNRDWQLRQRGRNRQGVDLFSMFTGALAVQESLQLETLGVDDDSRTTVAPTQPKGAITNRSQDLVAVSTLTGPTIKSHPWEQMLAGRKPDVGPLAACVPEDFFFVEFKSFGKLLAALHTADLWGDHLFTQVLGQAASQDTERRLKKQLGIAGIPPELIDAMGVEAVGVTGSDLYLADGSDVTLLVLGKNVVRMRQWADTAFESRKQTGEYLGVAYVHASTPDGDVNAFTADPRPDLHVRSNSLPAFRRVLATIVGKTPEGQPVRRLSDTQEFAYMRTIFPRGVSEEDGLIYLSDPCIRRLVGPRVKLSQRRRLIAFNHLKMIEHAALMFRTERGRAPQSLDELATSGCAPGVFGADKLACPAGGTYALAANGMSATSSVFGRPGRLKPLLELPLDQVTQQEASAYRQFLEDYNRYWRTYFDPIALRVQVTPQQCRLETVILPLLDNSIYTTMAAALSGPAAPLDPAPVGKKTILTMAMRFNKQPLLDILPRDPEAKEPGKKAPDETLTRATANMRRLMIAHHNYAAAGDHFARPAIMSKEGKPLLSWRVELLPYLEQQSLYGQFKRDEPWDSDHNKKLIAKIPAVFQGRSDKLAADGKTPFVLSVGKEAAFPLDGKRVRFEDFTDGLSNTLGLLEVIDEKAVVWTKPEDFEVNLKEPFKGLTEAGRDTFLTAFGDGRVMHLRDTVPAETMKALVTRNGGETFALDEAHYAPLPMSPTRRGSDLLPIDEFTDVAKLRLFLTRGIGDQAALHVFDADQPIGTEVTALFGSSGLMQEIGLWRDPSETALIGLLVSSLTHPVCLCIPVKDAKIVDEFLDEIDRVVQKNLHHEFSQFINPHFYRIEGKPFAVRCVALKPVGLTLRICWARVGNMLCIVNHPAALDEIAATSVPKETAPVDTTAHALVRVRPENWNTVLPTYNLGWAERHRAACGINQIRVGNVARAYPDLVKNREATPELMQRVAQIYGIRPYCPDAGRYACDGANCTCSVHGGEMAKQPLAPSPDSATAKTMRQFRGLTATLTFREDGLHAVVVVQRRGD